MGDSSWVRPQGLTADNMATFGGETANEQTQEEHTVDSSDGGGLLSQPSPRRQSPEPPQPWGGGAAVEPELPSPALLRQLDTLHVSMGQQIAEVKGIYAGLVMVESKCREVDEEQAQGNGCSNLTDAQWQALTALHRTLLHEHHDFLMASLHPTGNAAMKRLAAKYAMPQRMWAHGILSFLELLRRGLPNSLEHMLHFVHMVYNLLFLLYETAPLFEFTWVEYLADVSRYRMSVGDDDSSWAAVARYWYSKAIDHEPTTGRFHHRLAVLARPRPVAQLCYYTKAVCVPSPFPPAHDSIRNLFDQVMAQSQNEGLTSTEDALVYIHALLCDPAGHTRRAAVEAWFLSTLDPTVKQTATTTAWTETGYQLAIANANAVLGYGTPYHEFMQLIQPESREGDPDVPMTGSPMDGSPMAGAPNLEGSISLLVNTSEVVLRSDDPAIHAYLHVTLVLLNFPGPDHAAMFQLEDSFPWKLLASTLNVLLIGSSEFPRIEGADFPQRTPPRLLPEDYALRSLFWAATYHPKDFFESVEAAADDHDRYFERASYEEERVERILWLGCQIAKSGRCLVYRNHRFEVAAPYDVDIGPSPWSHDGDDWVFVEA